MNKRTYYTAMRLGLLEDFSNGEVLAWQKEDYRAIPTDQLFFRLQRQGVELNQSEFLELAENFESPEDLSDEFLDDVNIELEYDQSYLILFELWRRLIPEKQSLSIFCDELDHLIELYDEQKLENLEPLQDAIDQLQIIIEENGDYGKNSQEAFKTISEECANILEDFLYDFTFEQIEQGNIKYASELTEKFREFIPDSKWFDLLHARLLLLSNQPIEENLTKLVNKAAKDTDLDFNFDLLAFLARTEDKEPFRKIVKKTISLLETEVDFQDLLNVCQEYFVNQNLDTGEEIIEQILEDRKDIPEDAPFNQHDKNVKLILGLLA